MQTLTLTTVVQIVGDIDAAQRADILQRIESGQLDLPLLQLLRAEFSQRGADWRFRLPQTGASFEVTP